MFKVHQNWYDVLKVIGEGGQAQVRLIRNRETLQVYAGKFLREHWDPIARAMFRAEGMRQMRVSGPEIVQVIDGNFDCEQPFIVLEYMPRGCLAEELKRRGTFPLVDALLAAREIAAALSHLHAKGVVHRDVKPANVLRAQDGHLVLNDLGLGATMSVSRVVTDIAFAGTPEYAAPEQHVNFAAPESDVYALGISLHELITGSRKLTNSRPPAAVVRLLAALTRANYLERPNAHDAYYAIDAVLKIVQRAQTARRKLAQQSFATGLAIGAVLLMLK